MKTDLEWLRQNRPYMYAAITEETEQPPRPEPSWLERADQWLEQRPQPVPFLWALTQLVGMALFGVIVFLGFLFLLGLMSPI